ncbi:S8 family serine peptidase [Candidatus Poriferisocius sp.]|uniref:S8 family serine peptidase n=1 Tax=Candidatus Poriferisocius sp. TaxID=3101276 RepID=UPI003B01E54E
MVVKARVVRFNALCLVLALLGGVLAVPAAGASPQSASAQQPRVPLAAEGESYSAALWSVEPGPPASGGELSARDGDVAPREAAPGAGDGLALEDGLAPEDGLDGPELGEAVQELGVLDLVGPDGVWVMRDGGRETPLRLLDAAEIAELGDARSLAASSAASAYAPGAVGNASGASAAGAAAAATPGTWFVSDTGQPHLLVGGVNVLFAPEVGGPDIEAVWGRHGVASGQVSPLGELPNAFLVKTVSDAESLRLADALSAEPGVEAAVPNTFTPFEVGQVSSGYSFRHRAKTAIARRRCNAYTDLWADELSSCQWYLDASGDYRYDDVADRRLQAWDPVIDINIGDVWSTTMGAGVTVAVVDGTWNADHEDLRDNVDTQRSTNWGCCTPGEGGISHGTAVAGVVGARDNAVGGRGVAPRATLVNYGLLRSYSDARQAEALTLNMETVAVANHSYGKRSQQGLAPEGLIFQRALETSLELGFGGKGTPHVKSAGNGREANTRRVWSAFEAANNYRGMITVCAVASTGRLASYSEEGPNLWVCGLSRDDGQAGVLAPVGNNHYSDTFGGTSAAAPMVSGVIALMRSVNAELTWRDVKVILADTARKVDPQDSHWLSGARKYSSMGPVAESYSFSHRYGFGLVDAEAAVDAAAAWALLPPMQTFAASHIGDVPLPGRGGEIELTLDLQTSIDFTEHVKVTVAGDIADVRDYRWTLVSPSGAESLLAPEASYCLAGGCSLRGSFDFGSSRHLGENARGAWKLRVQHMPTWPDCGRFPSWNRPYCGTGFGEVISLWGVEVTGHTRGPTEPVTLTVAGASVAEGKSVDVAVSVGGPAPTEDLVVPLAFAGVTAEAGADYTVPASITVPKGLSSATAQISIAQDVVHEGEEVFAVMLGALPRGYRSASQPVVVTIDDDDPLPTLTLHAAASVVEGGSAAITAQLSGLSSEDVTADLSASAVAPAVASDGWLASLAVLRVPAGSTASSGSVAFAASQNDVYELSGSAAKTFEVSATGGGGNGVADPAAISLRIDDDESAPVVSIVGGPAVAEGSAAEFTLTAVPVPSAGLAVGVTVAQQGAFGVTTGVRTVTIPASGNAVLSVRTTGDSAAEPDGSVTVTVAAGADYTPPTPPRASVAVFDDDAARLRVSIAAGDAVAEGSVAEFTLTADPAPAADLAVGVMVAQRGAFGVAEGPRVVTVPASGRVVLSVATTDDSLGEPDGKVIVSVVDGLAYDLGTSSTATVAVADDDGGLVPVAVSLSAGDASISENGGATDLEIALSRALVAGEVVSVPITVTGVPGSDWLLGDPAGPGVTRAGYGSATAVDFTAGGRVAVMRFEAIDDDAMFDRPITFAFGTGDRAPTHSGVAGVLGLGGPVTVTIADNDLPPVCEGRPTVSVADATAARGEDLEFRITLSCRFSRALVAHYYIGRGSEIDGSTRSVTFGPGDTSATVRVPTKDSDKVKFQVAYAPGAANALRVPAATGTVTETLPVVSIGADGDITEGAAATFIVTVVPAPTRPITVTMDVSQSGDYAYGVGRRAVVLSGAATVYSVATRDDNVDEPDGSVTATVVDGAGYDLGAEKTATVAVADDDDPPPQVDITASSGGTEGTDVVFTITAAPQPTADLDVAVAITASGDFGVTPGTRTVTIQSGASAATLTIATASDSVDEPDGSVTAALVAGSGYTVGPLASETVQVLDDDDPPLVIPEVSIAAVGDVTEGADAVFTVTATPAAAVQVAVTVTAAGDYGATVGQRTVNVPAGGTVTLTVATTGDSVDEADGSVTVSLDAPGADAGYTVSAAQGTASVGVSDDDVDPLTVYMIFFSRSIEEDGTGYDNQAGLNIGLTRTMRDWETLTVPLSVTGGDEGTHWTMRDLNDPDAVFANDFEVVFGPGDQRVELALTALADSDWDDHEITVSFGTGARAPTLNGSTTGVTLGISWGPDGVERADGSTTVVIIDSDDPPPEIDITAATGGTEGADAVFTITASSPAAVALDITVDIASSGDWGVTAGTQTVTIPQGATQAALTVATTDDGADEPDGSITATLVAGSGYTIGTHASRAAPIADDDDPPPEPAIPDCAGSPRVSVADATARQGQDLQFEISLSCRSKRDVTVYYAVAHDRRLGSVITITIKGGETAATVNVPTAGIDADIEFHIVYLIGAANNTAKATATITN